MAMPDCMEWAYYDPEIEDPEPDAQSPARDRRPEYVQYRDEGCDLAPQCLSCPLPKCRHDDPGWHRRKARKRRDRDIVEARRAERLKTKALATKFGVSRRTVHRILKEAQAEYTPRPSPSVIPAPEPVGDAPMA